jgi:hypothetical protein
MSPAFSADSINANESHVIKIIERFCNTLTPSATQWGPKWNASEMCTYLGFDIMGALVFGCDFGTVQGEENRHLANSVLPASMLMYWVRSNLTSVSDSIDMVDRSRIYLWLSLYVRCYVPASSRRLVVNQ